MKASKCGRLLATAGQDNIVRMWVVNEAQPYFAGLQAQQRVKSGGESTAAHPREEPVVPPGELDVYHPVPLCEYAGHTADVLDLSWSNSNNFFLLSSSMDKTVRLWHASRSECLACFLHDDFVTAIAFHPRNDKFFLSGSLDCKLRLWNIPEKKVGIFYICGSYKPIQKNTVWIS